MVSSIIFIYQSIRNSILGWYLVLFLFLAYFLLTLIAFRNQNIGVYGIKTDLGDILLNLLYILLLVGVGYFYFRIKPDDRKV